jgi:hypothetical protein
MERRRDARGRFAPVGETFSPARAAPMGHTRIGEWLLLDVRTARAVRTGSALWRACRALAQRRGVVFVYGTVVLDLALATAPQRRVFLRAWPCSPARCGGDHGAP